MSAMNDFHDEAMDQAFFALRARRRGDEAEAVPMFKDALENELKALDELYKLGEVVEPTYSVLHRSAATLALDCGDARLAEKLASKALAEDPPPPIDEELRDVLEQANFQRHLRVNGIELAAGELQMSLSGPGVGFGMIPHNEFWDRAACIPTLVYRTAERLNELPYRASGRIPKEIKKNFQPFLSIPRAASYAVTLKFGGERRNGRHPSDMREVQEVVDEFVDLMQLLDTHGTAGVQRRIPDPKYLDNFVKLAKKIAPDGERVQQVGFTFNRRGVQRSVELLRQRRHIESPSEIVHDFPPPPRRDNPRWTRPTA